MQKQISQLQGGGGGGGGGGGRRQQLSRQEKSDISSIYMKLVNKGFFPIPDILPQRSLEGIYITEMLKPKRSYQASELASRYPNTFLVEKRGQAIYTSFKRGLPPGFRAYMTIDNDFLFILYDTIFVYAFNLNGHPPSPSIIETGPFRRINEMLRSLLDLKMSGEDTVAIQQDIRRHITKKKKDDQGYLLKYV